MKVYLIRKFKIFVIKLRKFWALGPTKPSYVTSWNHRLSMFEERTNCPTISEKILKEYKSQN